MHIYLHLTVGIFSGQLCSSSTVSNIYATQVHIQNTQIDIMDGYYIL